MIGLSVMGCFPDMASGKVDPTKVTKIICSSTAETPERWERWIRDLRRQFWSHLDEEIAAKAETLLRQFLAEGRVEQPGIDPDRPRIPWHNEIWWHGCEEEILYRRKLKNWWLPLGASHD